jgi:hypothetical protein
MLYGDDMSKRIFYSVKQVGFKSDIDDKYTCPSNFGNFSISTTFTLEQCYCSGCGLWPNNIGKLGCKPGCYKTKGKLPLRSLTFEEWCKCVRKDWHTQEKYEQYLLDYTEELLNEKV